AFDSCPASRSHTHQLRCRPERPFGRREDPEPQLSPITSSLSDRPLSHTRWLALRETPGAVTRLTHNTPARRPIEISLARIGRANAWLATLRAAKPPRS